MSSTDTDTEREFEEATQELAHTVVAFLEAGERAGRTQPQLQGAFVAAFTEAVQKHQEAT